VNAEREDDLGAMIGSRATIVGSSTDTEDRITT